MILPSTRRQRRRCISKTEIDELLIEDDTAEYEDIDLLSQ